MLTWASILQFFILPFSSLLLNRSDLIDVGIERAVVRMQSVIEMGRYIRDMKVMPVKVSP